MFAVALTALLATVAPPGLVARIGTPAFRHCGHVVGISPDGRRLYSVGNSVPQFIIDRGALTVTDADTGRPLRTFPTLGFGETAAAFEFFRGEPRRVPPMN